MINSFADWQSLNEIFKWKYVGGENPTYNFDANGVPYEVVFRDDEGGSFEAIYRPKNKEHMDGEGKTGQGIPLSINGTFVDAIRDFLTKNQDWYEVIVHPYDRVRYMMFKREIQKVNLAKDYEIEEVNPIFYITRKQMSKFNEEWTGYEEPEAFTERMGQIVHDAEDKMQKEGLKIPPDFWDKLGELEKWDDIDLDLENLFNDTYKKLYHEDFDEEMDAYNYTPEYHRVSDLARDEYHKQNAEHKEKNELLKSTGNYRSMKGSGPDWNKITHKMLYQNVIEKCWKEWKEVYQKWIDYVDRRRASLKVKRFGL